MISRFSLVALATSLFLIGGTLVFAAGPADDQYGLDTTAGPTGAQLTTAAHPNAGADVNNIVAQIIKVILGLTGAVFLALMIAAGNLWMTAGGNTDQIEKARGLMTNGAIGIVVVFAAYVITNFVVQQVFTVTGVQ